MSDQRVVKAKDVMQTEFDFVNGRDTVREALLKMKYVDTHVLIVEKKHEHDEYGIVRLGDIARKVLAKDRSPDRVNIYEIMSKPVLGVSEHMDIRYCARFFDRFGIQRAPVLDTSGNVVGIIGYEEMLLNWIGVFENEEDAEVEKVIEEPEKAQEPDQTEKEKEKERGLFGRKKREDKS